MVALAGGVLDVVSQAVLFRGQLRAVDVELLGAQECALLAEELARVEKACGAVRAMAAARAAAYGAHRAAGFTDADDWVARMTGSSRQQARADLSTGTRLSDCPATKEAAVDGDLSLGQADEISRTEREKPGSEKELVATAKTSTRQRLAEACRKRRQEGVNREELAAKQRAKRSFRAWVDGDGMQCGQFRLTPVDGLTVIGRLQAEADRLHRSAKRKGSTEPWEAHAADALVALLEGMSAGGAVSPGGATVTGGPAPAADEAAQPAAQPARQAAHPTGPSPAKSGQPAGARRTRRRRADVVFVVDLRTYRSGEHDASVCHVIGGGPVPICVVREMAKDAFLKVVFHDGVNIHTVTHVGRYIPAELRTALELGGPPDFEGVACSVCGNTFRLEWDHVKPISAGGITSFENEDAKCWTCHNEKSERERAAGLYDRRRRERAGEVASEPEEPP